MTELGRRRYTPEDYDLIEMLLGVGLPPHRIGAYLDPPVDGRAVTGACARAGIDVPIGFVGRPSKADRARWDRIERELRWLDAGEESARQEIERFAAERGFQVIVIKKKPLEDSRPTGVCSSRKEVPVSDAPSGGVSIQHQYQGRA